ncbi:hypothetical protein [Sulfitobacter sp.]|uniref:hypothetical protein n=1 Tax=Sulfitobacter sp. TaxID=1903071 RepID=UPI003297762C
MKNKKRYLPLFGGNGQWIKRPDLYILARMAVSGSNDEDALEQAYLVMSELSDNSKEGLNRLETQVEKQFVRKYLTERRRAAMVLLELYRLHQSQLPTTSAMAIKLVTIELLNEQSGRSVEATINQVTRAFRDWRDTCHLQLALFMMGRDSLSFENDPDQFDLFLSRAKTFEKFMDQICTQGKITWNPWRVPLDTKSILLKRTKPVSSEELKSISEI